MCLPTDRRIGSPGARIRCEREPRDVDDSRHSSNSGVTLAMRERLLSAQRGPLAPVPADGSRYALLLDDG